MAKIYSKNKIKNVIFCGTPEFAVRSLEALCASEFRPVLVITQPDKPKGRKQKLQPTPVKISSLSNGVPIIQPSNINSESVLEIINDICPDIIITVAYGGYIAKRLRSLPTLGCINLHPSLLPLYRGASPLQSALFDNVERSGNSIFRLVAKMDAGDILKQEEIDVPRSLNFTEYNEMMAEKGAELLIQTLNEIQNVGITSVNQNHELATSTVKISKEDLIINWNDSWQNIQGKVRGLSYQPGAKTKRKNKGLKILRVEHFSDDTVNNVGTITQVIKNKGFVVACQNGELLVTEVQPEGKKIMTAHAYNLGARLELNEILG